MTLEIQIQKLIYEIGNYIINNGHSYGDMELGRNTPEAIASFVLSSGNKVAVLYKLDGTFSEEIITWFIKKGCKRSELDIGFGEFIFVIH